MKVNRISLNFFFTYRKNILGSITLEHWQRLAKTDITTILNNRPGIQSKLFSENENTVLTGKTSNKWIYWFQIYVM